MTGRMTLKALLLTTSALMPATAFAHGAPKQLPTCAQLGTDPAYGLAGNPDIANLTSTLVGASGTNLARCEVVFTYTGLEGPKYGYLPGQTSTIGIRVGLPLSGADGGTDSVKGNWNGKVKSLGNGGFAGAITGTTNSTNAGYVGTGSDTGHTGGSASFGLNPDGTVNLGRITDYGFRGQRQANLWGRQIAKTYYGQKPTRNYWQGCSDGGREGHEMMQRYGDEFDGILAISPAIYWDRWGYAGGWSNYLSNALLGTPGINAAKYAAVNNEARAQCDGLDGIVDGSIQDTRRCNYDANSFVCKNDGADPANCLTPEEAIVVNQTWRGISDDWNKQDGKLHMSHWNGHDNDKLNVKDNEHRIWYGWERGTNAPLSISGATPNLFGEQILRFWVKKDAAFDWKTLTPDQYIEEIRKVRKLFGGYIGSDSVDVDRFRKSGGKMIATYGNADQVIPPNGIFHYYNRLMNRHGGARKAQEFYRFFMFPDATHCGGAGMNTDDLFVKLVDWVENGVEPDHYVATVNPTRTRKVCMYPNVAQYIGTGSTDEESNFRCQVNKSDQLVKTVDVDNIERSLAITTLGNERDDHDHGHGDRWAER
jgi:tannase/feruloyl esterase